LAKTKKGHRAYPKKARPSQLIDQANTHAIRDPDEEGYFNAIMIYDFSPGALYQVYCAPLKITDIQLQPGETVLGAPACGDTVRWVLGFGTSKENGQSRQHIYLKPTRHGLETTLTINTNRRTYHLELHSTPSSYMAAMNFRYPEDELSKVSSQVQSAHEKQAAVTSTLVSLDRLNFHYDIETEGEEAEGFKPLKVFDDGQKTFIQFPQSMRYHEAPALFIVAEDKTLQIVNYRKKNDFYIVDRLFKRAELRLGQKDPARVRITRQGG
jgi:type IV secretion system protein VirB9